jgi:predicted GH43/DUF377 family glycosyl hydrolase
MVWEKRGLIYKPTGEYSWNMTHAQVPTAYRISEDTLRIFYCARDSKNISRISFVDLDFENPNVMKYSHNKPILEPGKPGSFDDSGVMPSWAVQNGSDIFLYYIGWNVRNTVPYYNSVGLAISKDGGTTFTKFSEGPLWDRNYLEPYFSASTCVLFDEGRWRCWYLSCTEYRLVDNKYEPRYHIKYCESSDGIEWKREGKIAIDYKDIDEAGIVKASVLKEDGIYKMWYSFRNFQEFRTNVNNSYKIGYAESENGYDWNRKDNLLKFSNGEEWDTLMMCYPHVIKTPNQKIMFYNGNGFGQSGFGYAVSK